MVSQKCPQFCVLFTPPADRLFFTEPARQSTVSPMVIQAKTANVFCAGPNCFLENLTKRPENKPIKRFLALSLLIFPLPTDSPRESAWNNANFLSNPRESYEDNILTLITKLFTGAKMLGKTLKAMPRKRRIALKIKSFLPPWDFSACHRLIRGQSNKNNY